MNDTNSNTRRNEDVNIPLPWSKRHKRLTKASSGGLKFSLSNSFAQPVTTKELIEWSKDRGDHALVEEYLNHSLEYTPNGGSKDVREAIAELYGPKISAENILVFPGAQIALQTAARAICHQDMHAITFTPGYQSVVTGPLHAGAGSVTQIKLKASNDWQIDLKEVEAAIQPNKTRYIVLNQPSNPAGIIMPQSTQTKIIELARKHKIYILCDEVYRLLEHDPKDRLPAMCDAYEYGMSVVTLSKPWGACGITIGWIATQERKHLMENLTDLQYFGCACPSRASELQAIMCLRASDIILERNMRIIKHNKALLQQFMDDYQEFFHWVCPSGGAIAAIHFKGPMTSEQFGDALAQFGEGIGIKPAYCFADHTTHPEDDYFRIGFGESKIPEALNALRSFVESNKGQWRDSRH